MAEKKLGRKERERLLHQEEIFQAAEKLFSEKGFEATTMDDIAAAAEFAKGTLYKHFESKDELFTELVGTKIEAVHAIFRNIIAAGDRTKELVRSIIHAQLRYFEDNLSFLKILIAENSRILLKDGSETRSMVRKKYLEHTELFAEVLQQVNTSIAPRTADIISLACALTGMINAFAFNWALNEQVRTRSTLSSYTDTIFSIFCDGSYLPHA